MQNVVINLPVVLARNVILWNFRRTGYFGIQGSSPAEVRCHPPHPPQNFAGGCGAAALHPSQIFAGGCRHPHSLAELRRGLPPPQPAQIFGEGCRSPQTPQNFVGSCRPPPPLTSRGVAAPALPETFAGACRPPTQGFSGDSSDRIGAL